MSSACRCLAAAAVLAASLTAYAGTAHPLIVIQDNSARICLEAESAAAVEAPMRIGSESKASGEKCVELPDNACKALGGKGGGSAAYKFSVTRPGRYVFWCRVHWQDGCGNSLKMQLDKYETTGFGYTGTYNYWHWVTLKGKKFRLTKGEHTLTILYNEDGTKFDQILFTDDDEYVPVGIESAD